MQPGMILRPLQLGVAWSFLSSAPSTPSPYAGRSPLRGLPTFTVETHVRGVSRALSSSTPSALRSANEAVVDVAESVPCPELALACASVLCQGTSRAEGIMMNPSEASVVRKASFDKPPHSASAMSDADDSRVLIAFEHIPMQSYCSFRNSHHIDVPRPS